MAAKEMGQLSLFDALALVACYARTVEQLKTDKAKSGVRLTVAEAERAYTCPECRRTRPAARPRTNCAAQRSASPRVPTGRQLPASRRDEPKPLFERLDRPPPCYRPPGSTTA
jgi:Zn finger protein HypA/HybF involved in hydrogenase expression